MSFGMQTSHKHMQHILIERNIKSQLAIKNYTQNHLHTWIRVFSNPSLKM